MIKFRSALDSIKPYIPGKPIKEVKRELGIEGDIIKLASNENPLGPSPKAVEALMAAAGEINIYPDDSNFYLREKISGIRHCSPDCIMVGNGSVEVLHIAVSSVCGESGTLVRSSRAFIMSLISPRIMGADVVSIDMKDYRHDHMALVSTVLKKNANVLYIDNPTNPLGTILQKDEIMYILENTPKSTMIILDEAYNEYLDDNEKVEWSKYIEKYNNLVLLSTFSKIYGLAGLRIGYMIANSSTIKKIGKVRLPFNVNRPAQEAAMAALDDRAFIEKSRKMNNEGRKFLSGELGAMGLETVESHTNFITFKLPCEADNVFRYMQKRGVIARPLTNYGMKEYMRVTIGTPGQNTMFIEKLKEVLSEIQ